MGSPLSEPTPRRRGLSPAALEHVRDAIAPGGRIVRVRPLRGGISSSVHLVSLAAEDGRRQAVVVRRYGAYTERTDPRACWREFELLKRLSAWGQPVPTPLLLVDEHGPFGAQTILLTRLPGKPLMAPRDLSHYLRQMAETLARLHSVPIANLEFLPDQRIYVERGLRAELAPKHDRLQEAVWAAARQAWPAVSTSHQRRALVHGDYWPGNLIWRRGRLTGIIDWEQPRLGDPTKDVATCRGDLSILFGLDAADEFVRDYLEAGGRVDNLGFWNLLVATWALREIKGWATVYPLMGRPDVTPQLATRRIRAFARAALEAP